MYIIGERGENYNQFSSGLDEGQYLSEAIQKAFENEELKFKRKFRVEIICMEMRDDEVFQKRTFRKRRADEELWVIFRELKVKEGSEKDLSKGRRIAKMMKYHKSKEIFSMKYYRDVRTEKKP